METVLASSQTKHGFFRIWEPDNSEEAWWQSSERRPRSCKEFYCQVKPGIRCWRQPYHFLTVWPWTVHASVPWLLAAKCPSVYFYSVRLLTSQGLWALAYVQQQIHTFLFSSTPTSVHFLPGSRPLTLSLLWRLGLIFGLRIIRFFQTLLLCVPPMTVLPLPWCCPSTTSLRTRQFKWKIPQGLGDSKDGFLWSA